MSKRERSFYLLKVTGDSEAWATASLMFAPGQLAGVCTMEGGWEEWKDEFCLDDPVDVHIECTLHTFATVAITEKNWEIVKSKYDVGCGNVDDEKDTSSGYILAEGDAQPYLGEGDDGPIFGKYYITDSRLD